MRRVVIALVVLTVVTVGFVGVGAADEGEFRLEIENLDTGEVEYYDTGVTDEIELEEDGSYQILAEEYIDVNDEWEALIDEEDDTPVVLWGFNERAEESEIEPMAEEVDWDYVTGAVGVEAVEAGTYDYTMVYYDDTDTLLDEHDVTFNVVDPDAEHEFDVEITDIDDEIEVGETLTVTADIENVGDDAGEEEVTASIEGDSDDSVVSLDPDESTTETFELDTDGLEAGNYSVDVESDTDSDEGTATLLESEPLDIEITDIDDEIGAGETLTVDIGIEASGSVDTEIVTEFIVDGTIIDDDWEEMTFSDGEYKTHTVEFSTADVDPGDHTVQVWGFGVESDEDEVDIEVAESSFAVDIISTPDSVEVGGEISVTAEIENEGGVGESQEIVGVVDGQSDSEEVELDAGETTTIGLDIPAPSTEGSYDIDVESDDDSDTATVDVVTDAPDVEIVDPVSQDPLEDMVVDYGELIEFGLMVDDELQSTDDWDESVTGDVELIEISDDRVEVQALGDGSIGGEYDGYFDSVSVSVGEIDPVEEDIRVNHTEELVVDVLRSEPADTAGVEVHIIDQADGELVEQTLLQPDPGEWGSMSWSPDENKTVSVELIGDYEDYEISAEEDGEVAAIGGFGAIDQQRVGGLLAIIGILIIVYAYARGDNL